jgi:cation:H+ antiporter
MPELATCIVAALKKRGQMALGNIIGSNISNILLILGGSAVIHPLSFSGVGLVDIGVLLLSALLVCGGAYIGKHRHLGRKSGTLMLLCEAAYFTYLILHL